MTNRPLSIAHISLARGYKTNERQTELLIKELAKLGIAQVLVCRSNSPLIGTLIGVPNLKVISISSLSNPNLSGHFKVGRSYSILHAHEPHAEQWYFVHYLFFGTPYIITERHPNPTRYGFFNRTIYTSAAALVGISHLIQRNLHSMFGRPVYCVNDCSSHIRPNPEVVQRLRMANKNRLVIGHVGALVDREKGQSVLLEVAKILRLKVPELVVVFVGAGPDAEELRLKAHGMPNIRFAGFKRYATDYIASFDIFVYPVNVEPRGSIILDAMELGVPVIASNVDGIPSIIKNGFNGLLVKPGDANTIANYIIALKRDIGLRSTLIRNGRETVKQFTINNMAASYYRIYVDSLRKAK